MRRQKKGRRRGGMSTFTAGLIGIVVLLVFAYLAYTKFANPFASKFTVHALFQSANGLRPDSLVRIAGVNVGRVESVSTVPSCKSGGERQKQCEASNVTINVDPQGLPLHNDATFAIRPRIFLEGNFFVDISPGSPSSPTVKTGHTFPITQGTEPVQFDQVLSSLQYNTRHNLQLLLSGYGTAVKKGGPAYNASIRYWLPAYEYSSIVAHDALGIQPHDLSNWIANQGTVNGALDTHPQNLKSLITDFNTTAGAFASQQANLQATVVELNRTLRAATPSLTALDNALCGPPFCATKSPFRQLAHALIPAARSTPASVTESLPFIHQLRLLVSKPELRGLTSDLSVTVPALAKLTVETIPFMRNGVRPASSCVANVIYPWSQSTLHDSHFDARNGFPPHKVYVESVDFLPGLAGESRDFDANGPYIRILGALGNTVTQSLTPGLLGGALQPTIGEDPAMPPGGKRPPLAGGDVPNTPCETQAPITDFTATTGPKPQTISADASPKQLQTQKKARGMLLTELEKGLRKQGIPFKLGQQNVPNASGASAKP